MGREIEELEDCTFQPKINKKKIVASGPVVVRGLGKFLEHQHHSRKLAEDKKKREAEVFGLAVGGQLKSASARKIDGTTIVKPFRLSQSTRTSRDQKMILELEQKERQECPFKPLTLESVKRRAIQE